MLKAENSNVHIQGDMVSETIPEAWKTGPIDKLSSP